MMYPSVRFVSLPCFTGIGIQFMKNLSNKPPWCMYMVFESKYMPHLPVTCKLPWPLHFTSDDVSIKVFINIDFPFHKIIALKSSCKGANTHGDTMVDL